MSNIGSLGPIIYTVSMDQLRTFNEFNRSSSGRWAKHEILGKKPLSQRVGPGLDTISFTMRFDASMGVNPRKELDNLVELERKGKAMPLVIGGKALGVNLWVITSLEQNWIKIDNRGNLLLATANISLEEYAK